MGGQFCHKTITKYTPEEFVDDIICSNRFYKQMLLKKVSTLVRRNLGLQKKGLQNVILKWPTGLIEMENCDSDITDVKRKSHASNICSSLLQDARCAQKSLIDTCPVVPTNFMGKYNNCLLILITDPFYSYHII